MALRCDEPQILIYFPEDPVGYHHRVLLRRLRDAVWVVLTPEGDVEVANLSDYNLVPLARGGAIPAAAARDCHLFGQELTRDELAEHHAQAARLVEVLGGAGAVAPTAATTAAIWRVSDTAAEDFGEEVAADLVNNAATGTVRGSIGLVHRGDPPTWCHVELVPAAELEAWRSDKHSGAGRDRRLGPSPDPAAPGPATLSATIATSRPAPLTSLSDWPHEGPRALMELLKAILILGLTLFTYHDFWVRNSGVFADSSVSWEHRILVQILALAFGVDRLDPSNCASLELAARRVLMIERAVKLNPKCPVFTGLSKMIQHSLDDGGGVMTRDFTSHIAQQAEAEARILKQTRLLREELEAKQKDSNNPHPSGKRGKNGKREGAAEGDNAA